MLILYSFIPFITKGDIIYNIGSSIAHFCVLYFIGAYLAKYPISENYHFKLYSKNKLQLIMFLGFTCSILLNFGVFNLGTFFKSFGNQFLIDLGNSFDLTISTYSLPFTLLQTIFYFLWFGTLNIKSKIINLIGPLTFGVYLIHDNDFIRPWLYKFLEINNGSVITSYTIFIRIIICTFIIFIVCAFVEFIRQKIFKFIENRKISRTISKLFYKYINNF